ncbi:MAG: ParB/RepB/Spo0J family partition protein [Chloroflexia bacterium]|nr:ParB/RepB/Spo0J family partition protein [Chloroflexia bacterium]
MSERRRLGRGLDALIPGGSGEAAGVRELSLDQIKPNPRQPRQQDDPEALRELAVSITAHGVIQPVIVTEVPGTVPPTYQLVAGERRWRAARLAGLATIPALIKELSPRQVLELALVENIQRSDLNALEEAESYQILVEEFGLSHEEIARQVGRSRPAVSNTLRLLQLPQAVRERVLAGDLSAGHARALLSLPDPRVQVEAMRLALQRGLSVRQTEALVRQMQREKPARPAQPAGAAELAALESRLQESLGTRVSLKHGKKGGRLTIYFYSDEELEHLLDWLIREA